MIDAAYHMDLVDYHSEIFADCFHLHILQSIVDWEITIKQWDLVCYSVQRTITRVQALDAISYTEKYRDLQQKYRDVQENYRTRDFVLESSISSPVRSIVLRNGTYPTLKTFLWFLNYRSFEGVEAPEGCENVA